jgi:hypothetical protein
MTMWIRTATIALLLAGAAQAAPRLTDKVLHQGIEMGQELTGRADGDLNNDGASDTAYGVASEDARSVTVMATQKPGAKTPYRPIGVLKLEPYPLGPVSLSIAKGVLKVEDLTGGTTATSAIYRYRFDQATGRMRLIGLDATVYSRTYAHDGFETSWNLLTGDAVTRELRLNKRGGDAAYDKAAERRFKRPSKPLYMETTPEPEEVMASLRKK